MPWFHRRRDGTRPQPSEALAAGPSRSRRLGVLATALALAAGAAAASGALLAAPTSAASGSLVIADLAPFTGPDAALGGYYYASCLAATTAMNAHGGVLGHQLTCKTFDTRGDPADAVPAANQMFATTSNLAMVIGCTS
ncbi:MAG: ABC transporter substrate-binding protein, partial [Candidatus Dormibacteria bacterium]